MSNIFYKKIKFHKCNFFLKRNFYIFFRKNIIFEIVLKKQLIKFILAGIVNTFIASLFLLLLLNITLVSIATLLSDIYYALTSYFINSRNIFKKRGLFIRYLIFIITSWISRWIIIEILLGFDFSKHFSVFIIVPFFAIFSFLIQKNFIFK